MIVFGLENGAGYQAADQKAENRCSGAEPGFLEKFHALHLIELGT